MRKPMKKSNTRIRKNNFEERFSAMVAEYNKAKDLLDTMSEGTPEYAKQKKVCDRLFANAEKFVNAK